jgi:hypothetical protein
MVLEGVIVYGNDMKVGGVKIIRGVLGGGKKFLFPLSPPHRMAGHWVNLANTNNVSIPYNVYYVK